MFQPAVFQEDRTHVMHDMMTAHPFATIVSSATGKLTADHVPLVLKERENCQYGVLQGHLAAVNPLYQRAAGSFQALAIFQGPQTYVTPSWYASKQEHGKVVPTWNYVVVHASGMLSFTSDSAWILKHLEDLTNQHERHRDEPWAVSDAPETFVSRQLRGLIGFELAVEELVGTWKVSQNKALKDWSGVKSGLDRSEAAHAAAMSRLVEDRARK